MDVKKKYGFFYLNIFYIFIYKVLSMSKKLIITEEDKKSILQMYGVLSEQLNLIYERDVKTTPQTLGIPNVTDVNIISLYEEDKVEQTKLKEYINFIKKIFPKLEIPLEETDRQKSAKYAYNKNKKIQLNYAIQLSLDNTSKGNYGTWKRYADNVPYGEADIQDYAYTVPFIGLVYDFMEAWNKPESEKNDLIVTISKEESSAENIPPESGVIDGGGAVIELPELKVDGDVFVDNKFDVTDKVKTELQNKVFNIIKQAQQTVPGLQISLVSMYVETSASRFRNTGEPAGSMTFKELSEARANTTATYISDELKELGVINVDKAPKTLNFAAEKSESNPSGNGDGTSGPNPPEGFNFIPIGNFKMTQGGRNRAEAGTPLKSREDYEKFKFIKIILKIDAKVQPNTKVPEPKVAEPETWISYAYEIKVGGFRKRRVHIPVPSFTPKPKYISGPKKKGFFANLFRAIPEKCAAYD